MDTLRTLLLEHPSKGLGVSLGGYFISLLEEVLPPYFRFIILVSSAVTAVSIAYVHYKEARGVANEKTVKRNRSNKKSNRNTR